MFVPVLIFEKILFCGMPELYSGGRCEMLVFRVCGVRQKLYVYGLYRNPDLDDWIFYYLLESMAAVQAEDVVPLSCLWVI